MKFYFAWTTPTTAFNPAVHNVEDEDIFAFTLSQEEGNFAELSVTIRNPRVGLLAPGRQLWVWFSWDRAVPPAAPDVVPLFLGRLVGIPENVFEELVTLKFIARPPDFVSRKNALANTMRDLPYWDPIWISPDHWLDDDTVLEARSELWHIDPVTHAVTASDVIVPEDGTIEFNVDEYFYDSIAMTLHSVPLRTVKMEATIPWTQQDLGSVDYTKAILRAFGTVNQFPLISSFTFQGLSGAWPQSGAAVGDGWKVINGSLIDQSFLAVPDMKIPDYFDASTIPGPVAEGSILFPPKVTGRIWGGVDGAGFDENVELVIAAIGYGVPTLVAQYEASRELAQVVTFTMTTSQQSVITDSGQEESLVLRLNANKVSDITYGNTVPIGDVRARDFVHSPRGVQAIEHLLLVGRAHLIIRSRAVETSIECPFHKGVEMTLRKGALIHGDRFPGGVVSGKCIAYSFNLDGSTGAATASIKIGSAVGYGGSYTAAAGTPCYANAGYVATGYQRYEGAVNLTPTSDVQFTLPPPNIFDDGVNFQAGLTAYNTIKSLTVTNDAVSQRAAMIAASPGIGDQAAVSSALQSIPTTVSLLLTPMSGGPFQEEVVVSLSDLVIPQQINLEAT